MIRPDIFDRGKVYMEAFVDDVVESIAYYYSNDETSTFEADGESDRDNAGADVEPEEQEVRDDKQWRERNSPYMYPSHMDESR